MAALTVATTVVGAALNVLFQEMAKKYRWWKRGEGQSVEAGVAQLRRALTELQIVLMDAVYGRLSKHDQEWMGELQKIAYDAEDTVDQFATVVLQGEIRARNKVRSFIFSICLKRKVEDVLIRLERMAKERDTLRSLASGEEDRGRRHIPPEVQETSSLPNESKMFGRDEEKKRVIRWLLQTEGTDDHQAGGEEKSSYSVLLIVGMAGVGKTTLAQHIFDDERARCFEPRCWVHVRGALNVKFVTKQILESTDEAQGAANLTSLNVIQTKLKRLLEGKRFLLVLDDVWDVDDGIWESLQAPLRSAGNGSRVLVTSEKSEMARVISREPPVELTGLPFDAHWLLFKKHAFGSEHSVVRPRLEEIAKEIVRKMDGSPLAAKTLGSQLRRSEPDEEKWREILKSELWDVIEQKANGILPPLLVSYQKLPQQLKPCFLYCSILPKDDKFKGTTLVQLWMAQGFVPQSEGNKSMEEIGREYLEDLQGRSFFQYSGDDTYTMHSLIHGLARYILKNQCLWAERVGSKSQAGAQDVRHLSCFFDDPLRDKLSSSRFNKLRTLLHVYNPDSEPRCQARVPLRLFGSWRCLRVLNLILCLIDVLPESISNLIHLRYLNISFSSVRKLPRALTGIYNLQTLILLRNPELKQLPKGMNRLVNLRHLEADAELVSNITGIGKLRCLQKLEGFKVGKEKGHRIDELEDMAELRVLSLRQLEHVESEEEAGEAKLGEKRNLHSLKLEWTTDGSRALDDGVLKGLRPHSNLKQLAVARYGGINSPTWMEDGHLRQLETLHLQDCGRWEALPLLGLLPSLTSLKIEKMAGMKKMGHNLFHIAAGGDVFLPRLQTLELHDMPMLEDWQGAELSQWFPSLRVFRISDCPLLRTLPPLPLQLTELSVSNVGLGASLMDSILGELWKMTTLQALLLLHDNTQTQVLFKDELFRIHGYDGLTPTVRFWCLNLTGTSSISVLEINDCGVLASVDIPMLPHLQSLIVKDCPELTLLMSYVSSTSSTITDEIEECLCSLTSLCISGCPKIGSLGFEVLRRMPMLSSLEITNCDELMAVELPCLTSLKDLKIEGCPKLLTFVPNRPLLPENESTLLPLELLTVDSAGMLAGCLLLSNPTSFKQLWMKNCPQLAFFTTELQNALKSLTSLELLVFANCDNLQFLPSELHSLPSLKELKIWNCPKVEALPENGLPSSLCSLSIWGCPELVARCKREGDPHRRQIAHIKTLQLRPVWQAQTQVVTPGYTQCNSRAGTKYFGAVKPSHQGLFLVQQGLPLV